VFRGSSSREFQIRVLEGALLKVPLMRLPKEIWGYVQNLIMVSGARPTLKQGEGDYNVAVVV